MLKIYFFRNYQTILFRDEKLKLYNIKIKSTPNEADFILCRSINNARLACLLFPFKKIILYQEELTVSKLKKKKKRFLLKNIDVINGFTGEIYFNNYHFLGSYLTDKNCDLGLNINEILAPSMIKTKQEFEDAKGVIFIGRYLKDLKKITCEDDLRQKRQNIAVAMKKEGFGFIQGFGWDNSYNTADSWHNGNKQWWINKIELLKEFRFNLCLENTNWDYYVTEKIWHAIRAGVLPVYWGKNNTIYQTFPRRSFVDAADFGSHHKLILFLKNMEYQEWKERMLKCLNTYNKHIIKENKKDKYKKSITNFKNRIL